MTRKTTYRPDAVAPKDATPNADAGAALGPPRVYVGSGDGKIRLYSFDLKTYALTLIDAIDTGKAPSFLAFDPDRHFAYAVADQQAQLRSFTIDPSTGKLTPLQTIDSKGSGPTYIGLDRAGQLAMVANYGGGTIALFPRLADGSLGASSATRSFGGSAQTHQIAIDPTNTFVYVPNKGLDRVSIFRRDGNTLSDLGSAPSGDGPRHIDFDRHGPHAYVVDENGSTISAFTSNASNGALTPLQTVSTLAAGYDGGVNTGAEIQVLPDSRHLIVSNRGDNSLVVFDIDASTGKLTRRARVPTGGATTAPLSSRVDRALSLRRQRGLRQRCRDDHRPGHGRTDPRWLAPLRTIPQLRRARLSSGLLIARPRSTN